MTDVTEMLAMAIRHRDADMLIARTYGFDGENPGRGCSVGCFAHEIGAKPADHAAVAAHFGVPESLIVLQVAVFDGLADAGERADWHVGVAAAYVGVTDWHAALHRTHAAILRVALKTAGPAAPAVQAVIDLHDAQAPEDDARWSAAQDAPRNKTQSAAVWSASWAQTQSAAAWAAESSVECHAERSAARSEAWREIAAAVLGALRGAKAEAGE